MPVVSCAIKEAPEHVLRPVIEQTARRLIVALDMTDVIKDNLYINSDFMAKTQTSTLNKDAIVDVEALRVDVNVQLNPSSQKWEVYQFAHTAAYGINQNTFHDNLAVYNDRTNNARAVEIQAPITLVLNCSFHLKSASLAYQLPYKIYQMFGPGELPFYQDLFYDYPVPNQIIKVIYEIYKLDRVAGRPAGVSFEEYITQRTGGGWVANVNRYHPDEYEIVQKVRDLQVLTTVEYGDDQPSGEKMESSPAKWEIPLTVTVQFAAPQLNVFKFPIVIYNQLLPASCIPVERTDRFNRLQGEFPYNKFTRYELENGFYGRGPLGTTFIRAPHYDDWYPIRPARIFAYGHRIIATIGVLLEENEDYHTTLDFNNFEDPNFDFQPYVYEIIALERELAVHESSLITLTVFENESALPPGKTTFIKDGVLTFKGGNLHDQYHVVVSMCCNLSKLNEFYYPLLDWFYKYFDNSIKKQIHDLVNSGAMRPPYEMDEEGNIFDGNHNFVGNINKPILEGGRRHNGIHFQSRNFKANLIAQRSRKS